MLEPTRGNVLLKGKMKEISQSGIYLPDNAKNKSFLDYTIYAIHPEDAKLFIPELKKGDRVFVKPRFSVTGAPLADIHLAYEKDEPFLVDVSQIAVIDRK